MHRSVFCTSAALQRLLRICCIAASSAERQTLPLRLPLRSIPPAALPASNIFPMALRHSASILFTMALPASSSATAPRPATSSRWLSAAAPPAGNKPHLAEKSTPVWLVIWRIWAGFANSQLQRATFLSFYLYICAYPRYCHLGLLLRQTQIFRPICTDCLRHLRISAK